jgi:hypothetical protein
MKKQPSNTREQCAYDRGAGAARAAHGDSAAKAANPHKKESNEWFFWNDGFDSVSLKNA